MATKKKAPTKSANIRILDAKGETVHVIRNVPQSMVKSTWRHYYRILNAKLKLKYTISVEGGKR